MKKILFFLWLQFSSIAFTQTLPNQEWISYENFQLTRINTHYFVNAEKSQIKGKTDLHFQMLKEGYFFFHFNGFISSIELDNIPIDSHLLKKFTPAKSNTYFYLLDQIFPSGETHQLTVNFEINPAYFRVLTVNDSPNIIFGTRYDNIEGVGPESIMPSLNRPAAHPKLSVQIEFPTESQPSQYLALCHCILNTNKNGFDFDFDETPLLQSFFYILPKDSNPSIRLVEIRGVQVKIILSTDFTNNKEVFEREYLNVEKIIQDTFIQMEYFFGKYQHGSELLIFLFLGQGTSMEYRGAVHSTPLLLRHELIHQWFGTSLSPIDYSDIWINESITVWLIKQIFGEEEDWNDKIPKLSEESPSHNLAAAPAFFQGSSPMVYSYGVGFLNLLDEIMQRESQQTQSLISVIQDFYNQKSGKHINTNTFIQYLNEKCPYHWEKIFNRLILGQQ